MSDFKTIIGAGSTVRGNIEGDEELVVQGRVEGTISISRKLIVEPGGAVHADVSVHSALIRGVLVGNIDAQDIVCIAADGRVVGDIRAPRAVLEEGAAFNGSIDMGEFDLDARISFSESVPASVSSPRSVPAPVREPEPEAEQPRATARTGASFSRPPMPPVPSRPKVVPVPQSSSRERRAAPEPRVRPVGRVKIKKPSF